MGAFYIKLLKENPYTFKFLMEAYLETPMEFREEIEERHNRAHEQVLKKINMDNFRKNIDPLMVIDLIHMVSHHIGHMVFKECRGGIDNFIERADECEKAFKQYFNIIKHGVYK